MRPFLIAENPPCNIAFILLIYFLFYFHRYCSCHRSLRRTLVLYSFRSSLQALRSNLLIVLLSC